MQSAPSRQRTLDAIAVLVLIALAALTLATFRNYGLGWDDYTHAEMGDLMLALYGSGFADRRALSFVNLYMYGSGFDMAAALLAKVLPFDLYDTRRLAGALVGLVGLAATWRAGRRIGGPLAGLIALLLLATCPPYYGHMFFNAKDAPFAVAMAVLLWALVRTLDEYPRPSVASIAFLGVSVGAAIGTRVLGGIAGLYAAAAFAFLVAIEWRRFGARPALARAGRLVVRLLPALVLAYAVMAVLWPWAVLNPLNPLRALTYFSTFFEKPWTELFAGVPISVPDMPWSYLPTLFALKLPEIFSLLTVAGTLIAVAQAANSAQSTQARAVRVLLLCAAFVPLLLTIATRPALYNGIRHFLFLLPPFAVLGGVAGAWLLERLVERSRLAAVAGVAVLILGLASPVVAMVQLHPYEYTHFNRLSGGVRAAHGRYMLDYWGLSFKQAAQALRATLAERGETPPAGRRWKIAICGPLWAAEVALGKEFESVWVNQGADFALVLDAHYCARLDAPVLAEIARDGVAYARVYDIRGRTIDTLLTEPAP